MGVLISIMPPQGCGGWVGATESFVAGLVWLADKIGRPSTYWAIQIWFCSYMLLFSNEDQRVWQHLEFFNRAGTWTTNVLIPAFWWVFTLFTSPPTGVEETIKAVKDFTNLIDGNAEHDTRHSATEIKVTQVKIWVTVLSRLLVEQTKELLVPNPLWLLRMIVDWLGAKPDCVHLTWLLVINVFLILNESSENSADKVFVIASTI